MNILPPAKIEALREAFKSNVSIRKAAKIAGVNRGTAYKWYRIINKKEDTRLEDALNLIRQVVADEDEKAITRVLEKLK